MVLVAAWVYATRRATSGSANPAWTGQTMGTTYSIRLAGSRLTAAQLGELKRRVDERLNDINALMSHYRPDSELSQFNASPPDRPFRASPDFARVLQFALEVHRASDGAFDPAIGALVNAWGFGPAGRQVEPPDEQLLAELTARSGARHIRFLDNTTLVRDSDGALLNLGAIAKGFGADAVAAVIRHFGISNFFVEIGGEVVTGGLNPHGRPWRVGIETPRPELLPGESFEVILALSDNAVATSGDYRNFRTDSKGRHFAHILDPRTGHPVDHNVASVTVVAPDCMTADALATAAFVLGPDAGMAFLEAWPGAEGLFLIRTESGAFEKRPTSGFERYVAR